MGSFGKGPIEEVRGPLGIDDGSNSVGWNRPCRTAPTNGTNNKVQAYCLTAGEQLGTQTGATNAMFGEGRLEWVHHSMFGPVKYWMGAGRHH